MLSKQGRTLPFIGLSEGHINVGTGTFKGATTFHCVTAGDLTFIWNNSDPLRSETVSFLAGDEFGVKNVDSIKVATGSFHIGFD